MIQYLTGNILESDAEALVNTVNTVGVMGKGVALQFRNQFPYNRKVYEQACKDGSLDVGRLLVVRDSSLATGEKIIVNFPTKRDWRRPSEYSYIEEGLKDLVRIIQEQNIKSIALPPLGSGNGGLDWLKVKVLLERYLTNLAAQVFVYEPNVKIQEAMMKERVRLTPARAMLLSVLYDLVRSGEFVSEFASEKIAYFLQRFGAQDEFKLEFQQHFYGPYSGKVKHVLYYLNGSYISGYSAKDKRPFEELGIVSGGEQAVENFLEGHSRFRDVTEKTKAFLKGFYSSFGLELLSTVDFIILSTGDASMESVKSQLALWSDRKRTLFHDDRFIRLAIERITQHLPTYQSV